jgi:hypothetical protein
MVDSSYQYPQYPPPTYEAQSYQAPDIPSYPLSQYRLQEEDGDDLPRLPTSLNLDYLDDDGDSVSTHGGRRIKRPLN